MQSFLVSIATALEKTELYGRGFMAGDLWQGIYGRSFSFFLPGWKRTEPI
jgi:hypothetical protein